MVRQNAPARGEPVSRPQLIQSMIDAMRVPELRDKILFTFVILLIFRFVAHVPVPNVDRDALAAAFEGNAVLDFLSIFFDVKVVILKNAMLCFHFTS